MKDTFAESEASITSRSVKFGSEWVQPAPGHRQWNMSLNKPLARSRFTHCCAAQGWAVVSTSGTILERLQKSAMCGTYETSTRWASRLKRVLDCPRT